MVTGRICDIGHMVLQASFQTGTRSNQSFFHGFLSRFSTKALLQNKILLCNNYTIMIILPLGDNPIAVNKYIICINNNNRTIINNNCGRPKYFILLFKIRDVQEKDERLRVSKHF